MLTGDNLVIPKVGHKLDSIEALRSDLKNKFGYTVDIVLMDVSPQTALDRMLARFDRTKRLINPTYFLDVVPRPPNTYSQAKQEGNFDGYSEKSSQKTTTFLQEYQKLWAEHRAWLLEKGLSEMERLDRADWVRDQARHNWAEKNSLKPNSK